MGNFSAALGIRKNSGINSMRLKCNVNIGTTNTVNHALKIIIDIMFRVGGAVFEGPGLHAVRVVQRSGAMLRMIVLRLSAVLTAS